MPLPPSSTNWFDQKTLLSIFKWNWVEIEQVDKQINTNEKLSESNQEVEAPGSAKL